MTTPFPATQLTRRPGGRTFATTWCLRYQDAINPLMDEGPELVAIFTTEDEAREWAWETSNHAVPLDLEEREAMRDGDGHLMGTVITKHQI